MTNICLLSCNRPRLLDQCLGTLYANTGERTFTACVVDDGSQDFRAKRILHRYAEDHSNFFLVEATGSSHVLAQLKNLAVAASEQRFGRGDWLYIGDSDTAFLPGWLEKLTTAASCTEQVGFRLWGGQVHPFHQPVNRTDELQVLVQSDSCLTPVFITEHSVLDGPSWLMRWNTWDEVGPMSRECAAGTGQSDDVEWCARLTIKGSRIGAVRPPVVAHCGITNTAGQPIADAKELAKLIPKGVIAE